MSKSTKIKTLLTMKELKNKDYQKALGLPRSQALTTKYNRQSFTSDDLLKLAIITDTRLSFIDNKTNKELITLDENDIRK